MEIGEGCNTQSERGREKRKREEREREREREREHMKPVFANSKIGGDKSVERLDMLSRDA
jgi:hypothetical protein